VFGLSLLVWERSWFSETLSPGFEGRPDCAASCSAVSRMISKRSRRGVLDCRCSMSGPLTRSWALRSTLFEICEIARRSRRYGADPCVRLFAVSRQSVCQFLTGLNLGRHFRIIGAGLKDARVAPIVLI
jgi:hypothetical protein